ncbi:MAG: hypothetical protein F6J89_22155 [Symploca sp. SIO1C4]|uniref:Uncharacterized protein n=1 Tax=Symploca sp. SIO1C4 TaxID=2607765 RepID=A0A6B3NF47_9CYAN|nr:hypothetical protein [Symploca sp. SIO2E9]NER30250.1 hypothetical protein [Symploca sp. SIO1C4]
MATAIPTSDKVHHLQVGNTDCPQAKKGNSKQGSREWEYIACLMEQQEVYRPMRWDKW